MKRTSPVVLLAALVGFAIGSAILGFASLWIRIDFFRHVRGGIHSEWTAVVMFGALLCFGLGGFAGATAAARIAKSLTAGKSAT